MAWTTLLLLAIFSLASPANALAREPEPRVFILQSYDSGYAWTRHVEEGIREALRGSNATCETFYLDAKRRPDPEHLRRAGLEAVRRIERLAPQVVISVDDAAQAYVVTPHLKGRASPQVVFCGVNAPLAEYGFPAANVSGVQERWHYREGFALLKRIDPGLRRVLFLVDDSETGRFVSDALREELRQHGPFALELVGVEMVHTFQQWQARVLASQDKADALALGLYNSLVDERTGNTAPAREVMGWTQQANAKPTLGFVDFAVEHGLLCGVLESGHEQGYLAGKMVRDILARGEPAGIQPVRINVRGMVMVNLREAERLGVRLPYEIIESAEVVLQ